MYTKIPKLSKENELNYNNSSPKKEKTHIENQKNVTKLKLNHSCTTETYNNAQKLSIITKD